MNGPRTESVVRRRGPVLALVLAVLVAATTGLTTAPSSARPLLATSSTYANPVLPMDFPDDIAVQRRVPYEARADAIMYRQVLAELAHARGWEVHLYDAKSVEGQAAGLLAEQADEVLYGPRATLGPPWAKDHRIALAATILSG